MKENIEKKKDNIKKAYKNYTNHRKCKSFIKIMKSSLIIYLIIISKI